MEKISSIQNNDKALKNNEKLEKTNYYLLNQPIKDDVHFGAEKKSKRKEKKSSAPKIIIGTLIGLAGVALAVKIFHKVKFIDDNKISFKASFLSKREETLKGLEKEFDDKINNKTLKSIKDDINLKYPETERMSKVSDVIDCVFKPKQDEIFPNEDVSENTLVSLYSYIQKTLPHETNPCEIEKNKEASIYLLSKLKQQNLHGRTANKSFDFYEVIDKKQRAAVNELIDYHFPKEKISDELREKIVSNTSYSGIFDKPRSYFAYSLNTIADNFLIKIKSSHIENNAINEAGKKLLSDAEMLNKKAVELKDLMDLKEDKSYSFKNIGFTAKTVENFKKGKFKTGYDEFWDDYFAKMKDSWNRNYSNNNYDSGYKKGYRPYTNTDVEQASMDIFKQYGEDLGDIKDLTEAKLKEAYKHLAKKYHPDKNPNNPEAGEILKKVNNANEALFKKIKNNN